MDTVEQLAPMAGVVSSPVEPAVPGRGQGVSSEHVGQGPTGDAALPVVLDLHGPVADGVRDWVEGVLGWQVVDGAPEDPVPAVLRLCDPHGGGPSRDVDRFGELPTVLLVPDASDGVAVARVAVARQPAAVLRWPDERDRLLPMVTDVLAAPRQRAETRGRIVVGGSAGGVGTSTVALALAGLRAWSGSSTLVAVRGHGWPWRPVPVAALGAADVWAAADPLPGLDRLRAVQLVGAGPVPQTSDSAVHFTVVDAGADQEADVLVCRPDGAGLAALRTTSAAAIVLVGEGPVGRRELRREVGSRRVITLPTSVRVARAALAGRVPAGLPGSWLAQLRPLVAEGSGPQPVGEQPPRRDHPSG